jgi:leucyl/phenylalanyl-tRNA--protein transferase
MQSRPGKYEFPNPETAEESGLLAIGGCLSIGRLLKAYSSGIFPWFGPGDPVLWWSPPERALVFPGSETFSKRTERALKRIPFEIRMDTEFHAVMGHCSNVPRKGQSGTWITPGMIRAYTSLHSAGYAHSIEAWLDGKLAGGLYGLSLGAAFFGESMFSLVDYASRAAFRALCQRAWQSGFHFIDGQFPNSNLDSLGAATVPRAEYLRLLQLAIDQPTEIGRWSAQGQSGAG